MRHFKITSLLFLLSIIGASRCGGIEDKTSGINTDYSAIIKNTSASSEEIGGALLKRAGDYYKEKDYARSIDDLTKIIETPNVSGTLKEKAFYNRSISYAEAGNYKLALDDMDSLLKSPDLLPKHRFQMHAKRADIYRLQGKFNEALTECNRCLDMPDVPFDAKKTVLLFRFGIRNKAGNKAAARSEFNSFLKTVNLTLEQKAEMLLFRDGVLGEKNGASAIAELGSRIDRPQATPKAKGEALFCRAIIFSKTDQLSKAIIDYTRLMEMPNLPPALKAKALLYRGIACQKTNVTGALADWEAASNIQEAPDEIKARALKNSAVIYIQKGDKKRGINNLNIAINLTNLPSELKAELLDGRGSLQYALNQKKSAEADWMELSEITDAPNNMKLKALNNLTLLNKEQGNYLKAIQYCTKALNLEGISKIDMEKFLAIRADSHENIKEHEKAIEDLSTLINMPASDTNRLIAALWHRGNCYQSNGDTEKALADFEAGAAAPGVLPATQSLFLTSAAFIYRDKKDYTAAIVRYTDAINIFGASTPDKAGAFFNRGNVYLLNDEKDKAVADWQAVINLSDAPQELKDAARKKIKSQKSNLRDQP